VKVAPTVIISKDSQEKGQFGDSGKGCASKILLDNNVGGHDGHQCLRQERGHHDPARWPACSPGEEPGD
jgi:hypothetical protein